jgi:tyrosyl-tRNA synthetase
MTIDEQIEFLRRATTEIISVEDLKKKMIKSEKTGKPLRVKLGVDPTASSVTLGWAVVLRKLRDFQTLGHDAVLIIGDFTATIGDPSGKSKTRKQLTREEVDAFFRDLEPQFYKILIREKTHIYHNSDWLAPMQFADVIRLCSKTTVARILERDDFTKRLAANQPLHLHEILYPLCQAQDSVAIESDIELGGNDQKFNNLLGRDLQREVGQQPQVVVLSPLLVGTDGVEKMSQSLGNYIGITEPPETMYGKVMSIPDNIMTNYFELATDVPMDEVKKLEAAWTSGQINPMEAKRRLAREIVTLYHDAEAAQAAEEHFTRLFSKREEDEEAPEHQVPSDLVRDGIVSLPHLIAAIELAPSVGAARRLIEQGGVELNGKKVKAQDPIPLQNLDNALLKVGKLKFARLKV